MNSHIKRPRMTANWRIGSRKKVYNSHSQIREIANEKTAYNEVCLYCKIVSLDQLRSCSVCINKCIGLCLCYVLLFPKAY